MIRTKNSVFVATAVASCLLVSACGSLKSGPYRSFSGKQMLMWGQNAPTASCDDLFRQKKTIQGLMGGSYKTSYGAGSLLKVLAPETLSRIDAQAPRCPDLHNSKVQNIGRYFTG
ncbi:MAG: hypothetical protein ACPGVN_05690 [Alphaproteobacteria bacterium]